MKKYYPDGDDLPYRFDLLWDVKTIQQVEAIVQGGIGTGGSGARPIDLVELFLELGLPMPPYLKEYWHTWIKDRRKLLCPSQEK